MIGLTITDNEGNVTTYNPHILNNQMQHFDLGSFQLGVDLIMLTFANQLNTYVSTLDLANVSMIVLELNNNTVTYTNNN